MPMTQEQSVLIPVPPHGSLMASLGGLSALAISSVAIWYLFILSFNNSFSFFLSGPRGRGERKRAATIQGYLSVTNMDFFIVTASNFFFF